MRANFRKSLEYQRTTDDVVFLVCLSLVHEILQTKSNPRTPSSFTQNSGALKLCPDLFYDSYATGEKTKRTDNRSEKVLGQINGRGFTATTGYTIVSSPYLAHLPPNLRMCFFLESPILILFTICRKLKTTI